MAMHDRDRFASSQPLSSLDEEFRAHTSETLRPLASLATALYSFLALAHFLVLPAGLRLPLASLAALTALSAAALRLRWARIPPCPSTANLWTAYIVGIACFNSLVHLYLTHDAKQSTNMALLMIGSGYLFLSIPWFVSMLTLEVLAWAVVLSLYTNLDDALHFTFMVIIGLFLSVLLHRARSISVRRSHHVRGVEQERSAALSHAHNMLLELLNESWLISWRTDRDGEFDFVNDAWWEFTGRSRSENIADSLVAAIHLDDRERYFANLNASLIHHAPFDVEYRILRADGQYRWVSDRGWPYTDFKGDFAGYIGGAQDITERVEAVAALRESNERFHMVIEATRTGIWDWDLDANRIQASRVWDVLLGYGEGDTELEYDAFAARVHPEDIGRIERTVAWFRKHPDITHTLSFRLKHRNGAFCWMRTRAKLVVGTGKDAHDHILGVMEDITRIRKAEEERRRLEMQIQHKQKLESLGVLAGGIAHDFNNILVSILGHADIASSELPAGSGAQDHLDVIVMSSRRAAELCRQMLAYAGKGKIFVGQVDLSSVVRDMASMFEVTITKKAHLHVDAADGLPSIQADPAQIQQVIMNLITNASDALGDEPGDIVIRTGACQCDRPQLDSELVGADTLEPGAYVYVEVRDTGCGFDEETRNRIFDPFFTTKFTGRGLGLAAVLGIVRSHSGALKMVSTPGEGSTFTVLFPAAARPAEVPIPEERERTGPSTPGAGTILIVDDEASVRKLAAHVLVRAGYTVIEAEDGERALTVFAEQCARISAILLDLTMPNLNGSEVLERLAPIRHGTPVILTSGYTNGPPDLPNDGAGGPITFLPKPYSPSGLLAKIRDMLHQSAENP